MSSCTHPLYIPSSTLHLGKAKINLSLSFFTGCLFWCIALLLCPWSPFCSTRLCFICCSVLSWLLKDFWQSAGVQCLLQIICNRPHRLALFLVSFEHWYISTFLDLFIILFAADNRLAQFRVSFGTAYVTLSYCLILLLAPNFTFLREKNVWISKINIFKK